MEKKFILKSVVGSRLHGTHNKNSDWDYRGVFMVPMIDILSPFREAKDSHWIEKKQTLRSIFTGDKGQDDTAYELSKFCKMCAQGNPSCLEVMVGLVEEKTKEGEELIELLPKFLSKNRCYEAFRGYSRNQEKKLRDNKEVKESSGGKDRKWKYASAHIRTMYQLLHLLKTGELIGRLPEGQVEEIRNYKEGRGTIGNFFSRIDQLEQLCEEALEGSPLPDSPDIEAIENFIYRSYLANV